MAAVALQPRDNAESTRPCLHGGLTLARGDDPAGAKEEPGGLGAPGVGPWEEDSGDRPQSLALLGTLASRRWPSPGPPSCPLGSRRGRLWELVVVHRGPILAGTRAGGAPLERMRDSGRALGGASAG